MRLLPLALVLVAAAAAVVPAAAATVTTTANAPSLVYLGNVANLTFTKKSTTPTDGPQVGDVTPTLYGPSNTAALTAQSYSFQATPTQPAELTLRWTWTPTAVGSYRCWFHDHTVAGVGQDWNVTIVVQLPPVLPPPPPPARGTTYAANGSALQRNWGDWTATPNARNVTSQNYVRLTNNSTTSHTYAVGFDDKAFRSATGGKIQVTGNIAFLLGNGATPAAGVTRLDVDVDAHHVFALPPNGQAWLGYVILQVPNSPGSGPFYAPFSITQF